MFIRNLNFSVTSCHFPSIFKSKSEIKNLTNLSFNNLFSSKVSCLTENKWQNHHDPFFEKRPLFSQWAEKMHQRTQDSLDESFDDFINGVYSKGRRWLLSSVKRQVSPEELWNSFKSGKESGFEEPSILTDLKDKNHIKAVGIDSINKTLEKKGGLHLANLSQVDLRLIWRNLKFFKEYDAMVEIFNCCRPSQFTATNSFLCDYAFAHLNSSYCQPGLSMEIAERLALEEERPEIHYLMGLSLHSFAKVAQATTEMNESMCLNSLVMAVYKGCFPWATRHESRELCAHSFAESEAEFEKAFFKKPNAIFALGYILNLAEQKKIEEAKRWSSFVWDQLSLLADLTAYQAKVFILVGIIAEKPHESILTRLEECRAKGKLAKNELLKIIEECKEIMHEHRIEDRVTDHL